MPYGLTNFQLASVLAPLLAAGITAAVYLFAYDKSKNAQIASEAETDQWDDVKRQYGRMMSKHYSAIQNSANIFIDLTDPESSADALEEFLDETDDFEELEESITQMKRPQVYHKWSRRGAEYSPWAFMGSFIVLLISPFSEGILSGILLAVGGLGVVLALGLTGVYLYFRAKMNGVADGVQFRT